MVTRFFILVTLLFSFFMVVAHEEPPKTQKEKADAKTKQGKMVRNGISQVTIWKHSIENGIVSDLKQKYAELSYNKKGLNTSILVFSNDSLKYKTENVFDFDGNRVLDFDYEEGKPAGNAIFQYNNDGLIEKIFSLDSTENVVSEEVYSYKSSEKQIVFTSYIASGKADYIYTYSYNTNIETGDCTEIVHRDSAGKQVMRVVNVFDKNSMRIEKIIYDANNNMDYKFTYTYTNAGEFDTITKINDDGNILKTDIYSWDERGNLISIVAKNENHQITSCLSYSYE